MSDQVSGIRAEVSGEAMGEAEYRAVLDQARLLCQIVANSELIDGLGRAIQLAERSDAIGPFVDPTLWMQGGGALRRDIAWMRAVLAFRDAVRKAGR